MLGLESIIVASDAILEARYGSLSGHRKQRRSRTAFSAQQLQALERAFESTQVTTNALDQDKTEHFLFDCNQEIKIKKRLFKALLHDEHWTFYNS